MKPNLSGGIGESAPSVFESFDPGSLEKMVRFSFKFCNIKKYCVRKLEDEEIHSFYKTLGKFEDLTWKQVQQMPREKGFSIEKKDSGNHKVLKGDYDLFSTFLHFRVTDIRLNKIFRVFAARERDLCYILLIDRDGVINH